MNGPLRRLLLIVGLSTSVLVLGTTGYSLIEGRPLFDSFYMSLISLTTVGYSEVWPLTPAERVFTSILLVVGVTVVFASIGIMSDLVLQLELENFFGRKRTQRMLKNLNDHYIVCGAGRVGRGVIRELMRGDVPVVLIDSSAERAQWAEELDVPTLIADATLDQTLIQVGIERARGLVAAIGGDAENVYVTLTARGLNPKLVIAARASDEQAEDKLRRAGAATVFTPYSFIGHRLAQAMLRPHVLSFLDIASAFRGADLDLDLEQVRVAETSSVAEKTLEESKIRQRFGVIVLAIMRHDGEMSFNPAGQTRIHPGDVLIVMGERTKLNHMEEELEG